MRLSHRLAVVASIVASVAAGLAGCSQERPPGVFTATPVAPPPSLSRSVQAPAPPPASRPARVPARRGLEVPR
ncbi:MAG: hypothetical protein ABW026_10915 [Microvirga sp.]